MDIWSAKKMQKRKAFQWHFITPQPLIPYLIGLKPAALMTFFLQAPSLNVQPHAQEFICYTF